VPLFAIRQRLNVNLAFGFDGSWTSPLDVLGYVLFVLLAWLVEITLMLLLFAILLSIVAIPVTLVLDLLRRRRPRATGEATAFFSSFSQRVRSGGHPQSPPA
jgi:peptidoglycan/LPS O-acetylase OafA/YrhL